MSPRCSNQGIHQSQFLSNDITYVSFSLNGPITGADSRNFVDDVRDERSEFIDELVVGEEGKLMVAGFAAYSQDVLDAIVENLPIALAFIFHFDNSPDIHPSKECYHPNKSDSDEYTLDFRIIRYACICIPVG